MSFGAFDPQRRQAMMSDINVTPMVDVMLVLLVIFILAAPVLTQGVQLDLPRTDAGAASLQGAVVTIAINASGQLFWDEVAIDAAGLDAQLALAAARTPQPELQLRADKQTRYEVVAQVMAAAQARGLTKLGFVTEPKQEQVHGQR